MKPLAIDLFCGLGGWAEGFLSEGYDVIGFDIEARPYPGQLVIQDVLTLHGRQFRDTAAIIASPPCTEYSYMAMPWKRGKQIAAALRGKDEFPKGYAGSQTITDLNALFDACFRIQDEANTANFCSDCEAVGYFASARGRFAEKCGLCNGTGYQPGKVYIPMVVENVKGAQLWVGQARWHYGSFYLWGDVPALMPFARSQAKIPGQDWNRFKGTGEVSPHWRMEASNKPAWQREFGLPGEPDPRYPNGYGSKNNGGSWFNQAHNTESGHGQNAVNLNNTTDSARMKASAKIAIIPPPLAQHIARVFKP